MKTLQAMFTLVFFSGAVYAEVAVIVNPGVSFSSMSMKDVKKIFLGISHRLPDGSAVNPTSLPIGAESAVFNNKLLRKSKAQLDTYWSSLLFTGKARPPKEVADAVEMKALIAANPNAIGYIDAADADNTVKVVLTFN